MAKEGRPPFQQKVACFVHLTQQNAKDKIREEKCWLNHNAIEMYTHVPKSFMSTITTYVIVPKLWYPFVGVSDIIQNFLFSAEK